MSLSDQSRAAEELAKLLSGVTRVHVLLDMDPANPDGGEADIDGLVIETTDGDVHLGSTGFITIPYDPDDLWDLAQQARETPNSVKTFTPGASVWETHDPKSPAAKGAPAKPGEVEPGTHGCTCVGEIGEDPACAVHGKPIA